MNVPPQHELPAVLEPLPLTIVSIHKQTQAFIPNPDIELASDEKESFVSTLEQPTLAHWKPKLDWSPPSPPPSPNNKEDMPNKAEFKAGLTKDFSERNKDAILMAACHAPHPVL